jgi:hypothetical protein
MKDQVNPEVEAILRELDIQPKSQDDELPPPPETTDTLKVSEEPPSPEQVDELIEGEVIDNPPEQPGLPVWWLLPIGLCALAIATIVVVWILPLMKESASVIITPDRQTLTTTTVIDVPTRQLFTKTITLSQRVNTTGKAHQNATVAHGYVVFYNSLPSPQTVPAGTMLIGTDGVHIVTDTDAYIPAGTLATNGATTIQAHTSTTGQGSNIQAGDISGACCRDYVFARNNQFSGGQDARDYQTPTKTDIQKSVNDLTSTMRQSITSDAQDQLQPGEALLTPECRTKPSSDTNPGGEASTITVTLISTCTAYSYTQADVVRQERDSFTNTVNQQLGSGYVLERNLTEDITDIRPLKNYAHLTINLTGSVVYTFTNAEVQRMQKAIAGKSQSEATNLLLHTRGVHTAGIQIGQGRATVPTNPRTIVIAVYRK